MIGLREEIDQMRVLHAVSSAEQAGQIARESRWVA